MKLKHILYTFILLCILILGASQARAQTTWLVIPSQYWSSSDYTDWMPTEIIEFRDWKDFKGEHQCSIAARSIHMGNFSPAYSFCTPVLPEWRVFGH